MVFWRLAAKACRLLAVWLPMSQVVLGELEDVGWEFIFIMWWRSSIGVLAQTLVWDRAFWWTGRISWNGDGPRWCLLSGESRCSCECNTSRERRRS
ncbi:hypothetical protein XELAEV_18035943mg [Xenopus laevis]|uniref:Secreted protein n=1 Tax=Xenopus laevis TaxID=8355 RepID=A0A974HCK7_XENLA|nr:hypothetical protein XELAEV_18035943mg [Xenopus laevis]